MYISKGEGEGEEEDVEDPSNDFEATEHDNDEAFLHATVPENFKALRACLRCYLIKSFDQFFEEGLIFTILINLFVFLILIKP